MKVLVAEDDPSVLFSTVRRIQIKHPGVTVIGVNNAQSAMEAAQKGVDVLISDSSLPISSTNPQLRMLAGIEIAQAARDASPSVHTVLHSGNVLESILEDVRYFSGDGDGENAVIPGGERAARFAQKKADALGDALSGRGYEVFDFLLRKGDDPGALTELMKTLLGSGQEKSRTR